MSNFLSGKSSSFIGYSDVLQFVEDFGLYGKQYAPYGYARAAGRLERYRVSLLLGVDSVLKRFDELVKLHGESKVMLPENGPNPFIPLSTSAAASGFAVGVMSSGNRCVTERADLKKAQEALQVGADGIWGGGSQGAFDAYEQRKGRTPVQCLTKDHYKRLLKETA
jgi:hypothetical protein